MEGNVIIGLSLILLAGILGILLVSALVTAAKSGTRQDRTPSPGEATALNPSECMYDCTVGFQAEPELARFCGLACGVPRHREE